MNQPSGTALLGLVPDRELRLYFSFSLKPIAEIVAGSIGSDALRIDFLGISFNEDLFS
jgi:hypothetical protein